MELIATKPLKVLKVITTTVGQRDAHEPEPY